MSLCPPSFHSFSNAMAQCAAEVKKPKKPLSSFFLFLKEKQTSFVEQAGGNHRKGVSDASKAWKLLSPEEKAPYDDVAKEKLKEYLKDMKDFSNSRRFEAGNDENKEQTPVSKKPAAKRKLQRKTPKNDKDKNGRDRNEAKEQKTVSKKPAAKRKLQRDDGDKDGRVSKTPKNDKDKNGSGGNKAKERKPVSKKPAAKRKLQRDDGDKDGKVSKTPKKQKDTDAPKKPVGGAYGCYLAANRAKFAEECKGKPVTAVVKMASEKWKSLSEEDRKPFEEEYKEKKTRFDADMVAFTAKPTKLVHEI